MVPQCDSCRPLKDPLCRLLCVTALFMPVQLWLCWLAQCLARWLLLLNLFLHIVQANGRSPVWISECRLKLPWIEKDLPQTLQEKGLTPECTLWWMTKALFFPNFILHWEHGKGFSPEKYDREFFRNFPNFMYKLLFSLNSNKGLYRKWKFNI